MKMVLLNRRSVEALNRRNGVRRDAPIYFWRDTTGTTETQQSINERKTRMLKKQDIGYNIYMEFKMVKILVSFPDNLLARMRAFIPDRKRSGMIAELVEKEISKREKQLYQCALEVEKDDALNRDMEAWDVTTGDGLEPESW